MAHAFALAVYRCTAAFPQYELFGLTSQLRRAAASVGSNIVEGFRKRTKPDELRFDNTAQVSADECLYQLILAHDRHYADTAALEANLEEVSHLLHGYINGIERGGPWPARYALRASHYFV